MEVKQWKFWCKNIKTVQVTSVLKILVSLGQRVMGNWLISCLDLHTAAYGRNVL